MTKNFCDKCKKETDILYNIPIYKHITTEDKLSGHVTMIGGKMEPVSGVTKNIELCIVCYNNTMIPLWNSIKKDINDK